MSSIVNKNNKNKYTHGIEAGWWNLFPMEAVKKKIKKK